MATSPDRMVAGLVGDRYEITGLIASGGMGSVYRARDTVLDRTVALKVLKAGADDPEFAARFRTEATNAARLGHPNIVQIYDFGSDDGQPYMAMEFVDGQSLREILAARKVLRPEVAARVAAQVAGALEHARRAGIVHRDVKPENILITTEGQVKMADFGLSRALAESKVTQAEVIMGTAHYLAPEQVQGGDTDHRADLYALGVVLYEMLIGRTPFSGDSPVVVAYKRVAEDVPSILATDPELPRELDVVVSTATARSPDDRYRTAAEMTQALRDSVPRFDTGDLGALVHHTEAIPIQGQETIAVIKRGERQQRRSRKRRRWGLIALVLALVGASVYVGTNSLAKLEVPAVVGATQEEAKRRLSALGFDVDETLQNDPEVTAGHVISQDPPANAFIRKGSTIAVVVSLGPRLESVPIARGKPFAEAEEELRERGFEIVRKDVFSDTVPRLHVVAQDPDPGVLVEAGSTVTVHVSKGVQKVTIPDVVGQPIAQATAVLQDEGFVVEASQEYSESVPKDQVISQSPASGKVAKGSTVALVVSKGPPPVAVPDVLCQSQGQARDALASKGFKVKVEGSGKKVVDQDPTPGTHAPKGSTVTIFMGSGAVC